jgi:hypothetical protein
MNMNKIFLAFFLVFSVQVFAEDIYDRINECERQQDMGCMAKALRELATRVEQIEKSGNSLQSENKSDKKSDDKSGDKSELCVVGYLKGNPMENIHVLYSPWLVVHRAVVAATREDLDAFRKRWDSLNCGEQSKVVCEIADDGAIQIGRPYKLEFLPHYQGSSRKPVIDKRDVLKELQQTVCLE